MTEIILRSVDVPKVVTVIRNAIDKEISRLEKGTERSLERLKQFEDRYHVSSAEFAERFAAEDLVGKDLEYVEWMGEYRLFEQLAEELTLLKNVTYVAS
ncbi:hypothetical protein IQ254_25905 [Nodosilinea sp. LEGE 07088]|uniref:hypothetical protein n=1 Tax=Nodosilinea sp. LEGE 07088 TaxID=2777968 RepID=UPI0018824C2E|nr:hypothetical protein [Nodosilinea sp. LEGE 07088]MBE9140594.1 hypothetical protein [Nodosilinea sp. LEGE 07088]